MLHAGLKAHYVKASELSPRLLPWPAWTRQAHHGDAVALAVGAHKVGLAGRASGEDGPHRAGVVLGVDPVADVPPVAAELGADAAEHVGDPTGREPLA